jgi:dTDP-glucose pyrophosphorylase
MINKETNILGQDFTIRSALEKLTTLGENLTLFIVNNEEILVGAITDGDIRRGLIKGLTLEDKVSRIMNKNFKFIREGNTSIESINKLQSSGIKIVPVLDRCNKILRFVNLNLLKTILPIDAVIMAGGKGERLMPLTKDKPKPMLEVSGKPILEHNIDLLANYGVYNIHISVNYLSDQIKNYFQDGAEREIKINYIEEEKPLGTLGAVKLYRSYENDDILIMNSDVLTNINLADFYLSFKEKDADMSIATTSYHVNVPYAVLEMENDEVKSFSEKPTYTYFSNAGIYLIKRKLVDEIPDNEFYNATDLIKRLIDTNRVVVTYPILGYWLDIGKHDDYQKAQLDFKHIVF